MKYLLLIITACALGLASCKKSETPKPETIAEIAIGDKLTERELQKGASIVVTLSGGDGTFVVKVDKPDLVNAKVEGAKLTLVGLAVGETMLTIQSASKTKSLKVVVKEEAASPKVEPKEITDIQVGDKLSELKLIKGATNAIALSGGDGTFTAKVDKPDLVSAKVEGSKLTLVGLAVGETMLTIQSASKTKSLKVKVERAMLSLSESSVVLAPQSTKTITLSGSGDDVLEPEVQNEEEAISYTWNNKTGQLELKALHEGEASLTFKLRDGSQAAQTLKVRVKASNDVSKQVGLYDTTKPTLSPIFKVAYHSEALIYKDVFISMTERNVQPSLGLTINAIELPRKGNKVDVSLHFIKVTMPKGAKEGTQSMIVEEVHTSERLVTLRGKGFKIVMPYKVG